MEGLPFEGLLERLGWFCEDGKASQETRLAFRCLKDCWTEEELDLLIAALEVITSITGKISREIDYDSEQGIFFFTFRAVWNAMRLPCGVENTLPWQS